MLPRPERVCGLLADLERLIHDHDNGLQPLPPQVKTALIHLQFETIHPFLDGNGRMGRILIDARLEHWRLLPAPLSISAATQPELGQLQTFEDRLVKALEVNDFSVLTMVLTGNGEREFVFYARDQKEFVRRLSQMPQETVRYDARWDYFEQEVEEYKG